MSRPAPLGSVGATGRFYCIVAGVVRVFDGTTLGLVRTALAHGAVIGDVVRADYGMGYGSSRLVADTTPGRGGVFAENAL